LRKICICRRRGRNLAVLTTKFNKTYKMPIQDHFQIPASVHELTVLHDPEGKLFLCFISSTDPATNQPWCPDVRAALPRLEEAFSSENAPKLGYVHVGQKPEFVSVLPDCVGIILTGDRWKEMDNKYRKVWGINAIPNLVRYQGIDGVVTATGRLVEGEIMDEEKLSKFLSE
jgi:hypothetical protein